MIDVTNKMNTLKPQVNALRDDLSKQRNNALNIISELAPQVLPIRTQLESLLNEQATLQRAYDLLYKENPQDPQILKIREALVAVALQITPLTQQVNTPQFRDMESRLSAAQEQLAATENRIINELTPLEDQLTALYSRYQELQLNLQNLLR